jgi:hypothetical protein
MLSDVAYFRKVAEAQLKQMRLYDSLAKKKKSAYKLRCFARIVMI